MPFARLVCIVLFVSNASAQIPEGSLGKLPLGFEYEDDYTGINGPVVTFDLTGGLMNQYVGLMSGLSMAKSLGLPAVLPDLQTPTTEAMYNYTTMSFDEIYYKEHFIAAMAPYIRILRRPPPAHTKLLKAIHCYHEGPPEVVSRTLMQPGERWMFDRQLYTNGEQRFQRSRKQVEIQEAVTDFFLTTEIHPDGTEYPINKTVTIDGKNYTRICGDEMTATDLPVIYGVDHKCLQDGNLPSLIKAGLPALIHFESTFNAFAALTPEEKYFMRLIRQNLFFRENLMATARNIVDSLREYSLKYTGRPSFHALHLRFETPGLAGEHTATSVGNYVRRLLGVGSDPNEFPVVYLVGGYKPGHPVIDELKRTGLDVLTKNDIMAGIYESLPFQKLAVIDQQVAKESELYVGSSISSFSGVLKVWRDILGRKTIFYESGTDEAAAPIIQFAMDIQSYIGDW